MFPFSGAFATPAPTVPVMPKFPVIDAPATFPATGGVRTYHRSDGVTCGFETIGQSFWSPEESSRPWLPLNSAMNVVEATPLMLCWRRTAPVTR